MTKATTHSLSARQLKGLCRFGDALLPGDFDLPSFSESRCASGVGRVLDGLPSDELRELRKLLAFLGFVPSFAHPALMRFAERLGDGSTAWLSTLCFVRHGLRPLVLSLYYGNPRVLRALDERVAVYGADLPG